MSVQAKYFGSDRRCMVHVYTYAKLFGTVSRSYQCEKRQSIPAGKRKFTLPSFGKECKRKRREDAAVKL